MEYSAPDPLDVERIATKSRASSIVIFKLNGTIYGIGKDGVVSTHSSDINTVIQDCMNYLHSSTPVGGVISIYPDYYEFSSALTPKYNITIRGLYSGKGADHPQLQMSDGANTDFISYSSTDWIGFFHIVDLSVNGNQANNSSGSFLNNTGNLNDVHLIRIDIRNFPGEGIATDHAWGWRIHNCIVEGNQNGNFRQASGAGVGLVITASKFRSGGTGAPTGLKLNGNDAIVLGCEIGGHGSEGIILNGNRHLVSDCKITSNDGTQVDVYGVGNLIEGNDISGGGYHGLYLNESARTWVIGNRIVDNGGWGIPLINADRCLVLGNHVRANTVNGIRCNVNDGGTHGDNIIAMNMTLDNGEYGIYTQESDGTNENNLVIFNIAQGNTPDMDDTATGTILKNNTGYVTENQGVATIASGTTSVTVSHGLDKTPDVSDIQVTPIESLGAASFFYVDRTTVDATSFDIVVDADPTQDVDFAWEAKINA